MTVEWISKDLWLSSAVSWQLKIKPTFRNENGLVLFVFPASDELQKAVNDYYSGDFLGYSETVKQLKNLMYAAKAQG